MRETIAIPEYHHELEFQDALKVILEKKEHVNKVVIKRRGADLEIYHDDAFKDLHLKNKHIKLSNPFYIEAKLYKVNQRNVYLGIRQAYDKYSHRSEDEENKTVFLATPESIFHPLEDQNCHFRINPEPVYFPNSSKEWNFRFTRICWAFEVGVVGQRNPTLFALNDLSKFELFDKVI